MTNSFDKYDNIEYVRIFTDGSAKMSRDPWLADAGWVIYTGSKACANYWGSHFTIYRAELRADELADVGAALRLVAVARLAGDLGGARLAVDEVLLVVRDLGLARLALAHRKVRRKACSDLISKIKGVII